MYGHPSMNLPPEDAELRRALDHAGWRFTRQRAAVFDYLRSVDSHPTAEEVYNAVRQRLPRISLATVYKALEALVSCQLASKLPSGDGPARYDCRRDAHYHLRCERTGQIRDLDTPFDPQLLDKLDPHLVESLRRQGFEVTDYRLELIGHFQPSYPSV
jgi:Fe2+ or Zn2+ uptake regulation protein